MEIINKIAKEIGIAIQNGNVEKVEELKKEYEILNNHIKKEREDKIRKRDQEILDKCIKKEDLEGGVWYKGHRFRGDGIAKWDCRKKLFVTINYTMGDYFLEEINHFEEEFETRIDGFAPFEKI